MLIRTVRFSGFTLDVESACLMRDDKRQALSPKDFGVLHHLLAPCGRMIPHAELLETVWLGTVGPLPLALSRVSAQSTDVRLSRR